MRNGKVWYRRGTRAFIAAYFIVTLPVVLLFLINSHLRFTATEMATHYLKRIHAVDVSTACVGDSIMAGGRHWSSRLSGSLFDSRNFSGNGYEVQQIEHQLDAALGQDPECVLINGGTNDIANKEYNEDATARGMERIVQRCIDDDVFPILTAVPFQASTKNSDAISSLNEAYLEIANRLGAGYIDLNPDIADHGILLSRYTTDGVHLSDAAYQIWAQRVRECLRLKTVLSTPVIRESVQSSTTDMRLKRE